MSHECNGGGDHERGTDPCRVGRAPEALAKGLRMAGNPHHPRLPQVELRLVYGRHLQPEPECLSVCLFAASWASPVFVEANPKLGILRIAGKG